jgi:hypothetical protein
MTTNPKNLEMQVEQIINQEKIQKTPRKSRATVPKEPKKGPKELKEPKKNEETMIDAFYTVQQIDGTKNCTKIMKDSTK